MRRHAALAALAAAALAAPASGAPAPSCFQVKDDAGDGRVVALDSPTLDILSGDIATGTKNLVATIRMASVQGDSHLVGGYTYSFEWLIGEAKHQLRYVVTVEGDAYGEYEESGKPFDKVGASMTVDQAAKTVTWTVPRKSVPFLKSGKPTLTDLTLRSYFGLNRANGRSNSQADGAVSAARYVDGTRTCLKGT
jgi:hypothetical protein